MKSAGFLLSLGALFFAIAARPLADAPTLVIGGNAKGYLTPCGCTSPMSGGIRRKASMISQMRKSHPQLVYLEAPSLVDGSGRQDVLKAETLGQAYGASKVDGLFLGSSDRSLGDEVVDGIDRLSGGKVMKPNEVRRVRSFELAAATHDLTGDAIPVVVLDADEAAAKRQARSAAEPTIFIFRRSGNPKAERSGSSYVISPGDRGRYLVLVQWKRPILIKFVELSQDVLDDRQVSRLFRAYQDRVESEGLLTLTPKRESPAFAGSQACQKCHAEDYRKWKSSDHAKALATLEKQHSDRDPDCVSCHVVGLDREGGFISRTKTTALADVGCESCHGPAAEHVQTLGTVKTLAIDPKKSCAGCHNMDHSPKFEYESYWPKISHGKAWEKKKT